MSIDFEIKYPELYANLSIPSFVHGYSLGIELMNQWFLSKFKSGYFKTIHIMGKHPLDDFRRFEVGDYIKRLKPAVSISPQIVYDHDRENVDLYLGDAETLIRRSDYNRSFMRDPVNDIYLGMTMDQMMINFTYRIRVSTKAEQIDLFRRMMIYFKIGSTWNFDMAIDYHIPYDVVRNIATMAGMIVDENGTIAEPEKVLKYMNQHSNIPVLYKLRYINSKKEFFLRIENSHIHISTKERLDIDDGEMEGQLSNNFHIDLNCTLRLPTPKFYMLYTTKPVKYSIETYQDSENTIASDNVKLIRIPEVNSKGWPQYASSNYLPEKDEKYIKEIDIAPLFEEDSEFTNSARLSDVIQDSLDNFISPSAFIDIAVYTNDLRVPGMIPIKVDWEHRTILFPEDTIYSLLYITVYIDNEYVNQKLNEMNKNYEGRLN